MIIKTCATVLLATFLAPAVLLCQQTPSSVAASNDPLRQYLHRTWTSERGLPQNSVMSVIQTRDGFLWLGTQIRLVRFDGIEFTLFDYQHPALKNIFITQLLEAHDGTLWFSTRANGLVSMKNDTFKVYTTDHGLPSNNIFALHEDYERALWIGHYGGGLTRLKDGQFTNYSTANGLAHQNVTTIFEDRSHVLWIGTEGGLNKYERGSFTTYAAHEGLSNTAIRSIWQDPSDALWVGTNEGDINKLENNYFKPIAAVKSLPRKAITLIYKDRSGIIWIGTQGGGLYFYDGTTFKIYSTQNLVSTAVIRAMTEDKEGNLWIGTHSEGLHRLKRARATTQPGLSSGVAWSLYQDKKENIWVGFSSNGVSKLSGKTITSYSRNDGLLDDAVIPLMEDRNGVMWLGTGRGLNTWRDGVFTSFSVNDGYPNDIRTLFEDERGVKWMGGLGSRGIFRLDQKKISRFVTGDSSLDNSPILSLIKDRKGVLWIGTEGNGVYTYVDGSVARYSTKNGLTNNIAFCGIEDRGGGMLIGTYGGGINRIKDGVTKAWTEQEGLPNGIIYKIVRDDYGKCWMSSNKGIFSIPEEKLIDFFEGRLRSINPLVLDIHDGLPNNECYGGSQSAGLKSRDGKIWFPTAQGVVVLDPTQVQMNAEPPPVVITTAKIDSVTVVPNEHLEIAPGMEKIEFHYAGLSFTAPGKVQYQYKLDGFDKTWINAARRRTAYYTSLSPGIYTFWVRACNNDGVWNETGASFTFAILPHFYQTTWFYALCFLGFVGIGFTLYRIRLWQLIRREKELIYRVDEAMKKIKVLGGLIPICSHCKKIRDDKGYWSQLEQYLNAHSEASFSHGVCPECAERYYGDLLKKTKGYSQNPADSQDLKDN